jgi:hypothetical protein
VRTIELVKASVVALVVLSLVGCGGYAGLSQEKARKQAATFLHRADPQTKLLIIGASMGYDPTTGDSAWDVAFADRNAGTSSFGPVSPTCDIYVRRGVSHFVGNCVRRRST